MIMGLTDAIKRIFGSKESNQNLTDRDSTLLSHDLEANISASTDIPYIEPISSTQENILT